MSAISISEAKKIRESSGATHLVIFSVDADGTQHVATHGLTSKNGREAAEAGNRLKNSLGWPDGIAEPLPRLCGNCDFFKESSEVKDIGVCQFDRVELDKSADDKCGDFQPK